MKSADYWKKRAEQLMLIQIQKADDYAAALRKEYDKAIASIQKDLEVYYQRFADDNGIVGMAEARKLLNSKELQEFRWDLEDFIAKAKDNADGQWTQALNNAYIRTRVSRLQALLIQINQQVETLAGSKQQGVHDLLGDVYTDSYYRNLYEIQKGTGIGTSFAKIDQVGLETVLGTKLDGKNWSQRIWEDRTKLKQELYTKLSQSFIRGDSLAQTTKDLAQRMNVSYSRASTLVQTESAFFIEEATTKSFQESGVVERYENLAVLDNRTSEICREMDGTTFDLSEEEVGVNAPPFHAHCRTTKVPLFGDEEDVGERIARDPKTRKTYNVPGDMTYEQWHEEYVVGKYGKDQAAVMEKKVQNEGSDRNQFTRYKEVLGKDAPKTFENFQLIKYNGDGQWNSLKADYRKLNAYNKIVAHEPGITKDLQDVSKSTGIKMVGLDYRLKSKESYLRKVKSDSAGSLDPRVINDTIAGTNDVIRYTYQDTGEKLVDSYQKVIKALNSKGYAEVRVKNFWTDKRNAYNGLNCVLQSPEGQKFEVQFHTPEGFELKNGELHKFYEEFRDESTSPQRRSEITLKMFELSSKLVRPDGIDTIKTRR